MTISIIGWYGTETLGDRAILDGIFIVLSKALKHFNIKIGSLYPFFTERTLFEDKDFLGKSVPIKQISIFDIKSDQCRYDAISNSDVVIIGGGPLMDLEELFLLKKAMLLARHKGIPTIIMGCGLGPLNNREYIDVVDEILSLATKISFRDNFSKEKAKLLYGCKHQIECIGDPAIISIENYKHQNTCNTSEKYVVINFREYPKSQYGTVLQDAFECECEVVNLLSEKFDNILLVPMHTFSIGGDDRYYLTKIANTLKHKNIKVQHEPINLKQLYEIYSNAYGCIGMRYHAVVMQTILNGNNCIFNYTGKRGKIRGFLEKINGEEFYKDREFDLKEEKKISIESFVNKLERKEYFKYTYSHMIERYIRFIDSCIN